MTSQVPFYRKKVVIKVGKERGLLMKNVGIFLVYFRVKNSASRLFKEKIARAQTFGEYSA